MKTIKNLTRNKVFSTNRCLGLAVLAAFALSVPAVSNAQDDRIIKGLQIAKGILDIVENGNGANQFGNGNNFGGGAPRLNNGGAPTLRPTVNFSGFHDINGKKIMSNQINDPRYSFHITLNGYRYAMSHAEASSLGYNANHNEKKTLKIDSGTKTINVAKQRDKERLQNSMKRSFSKLGKFGARKKSSSSNSSKPKIINVQKPGYKHRKIEERFGDYVKDRLNVAGNEVKKLKPAIEGAKTIVDFFK